MTTTSKQQSGRPVLLGIPFDANSSWLRGPAEAPQRIREALRSESSNMWTETGIDLGGDGVFGDAGDITFDRSEKLEARATHGTRDPRRIEKQETQQGAEAAQATPTAKRVHGNMYGALCATEFTAIEKRVGELLEEAWRPVCLGGDHSITYPIARAFGKRVEGLTIIHFDAHPDLYEEFEANRMSHACPFARIMEEGAAKRLIQIGIRTLNGHQREQAAKHGVEVIEMRVLPALDRVRVDGPIYVSFDMDVLDPGCAPGVSHREPGGMSVREAIAHLHAIRGAIVGADLVEFNPSQDGTKMTDMVAAKVLKEMLGMMLGG